MSQAPSDDQTRVMNWSLGIAIVLLVLKVVAAVMTGSSAIYSDAAESVAHVLAVGFAAWALRFSHKPSDDTHHFGHDKVAFISSGLEGAMISAAALLIGYEALRQFVAGVALESLGIGMALTGGAALVNGILGLTLIRVGNRRKSKLIRANGEHVLSDVWTSVAVLVALVLVLLTQWPGWDPIFALLAAGKLLWTGMKLLRESFAGLMDEADLEVEKQLRELLDAGCEKDGLSYHNLRHRHSGRTHWVEFHLVFPDEMSVARAHEIATAIEAEVAATLEPDGRVITHLEPRSAEHHEEDWEVR
ncbi:cation diffusion facilitator family transporter [Haloferula luteola]|uniref:Cation diffusion facilitator family transporter n=1 Tax=Haloferula luteola TaxID=595692 RepID=A0A840V3A6_9BACT|nr:cation diffusion facilitator family transporter [Haloferula luteola]MBB5352462.1 cation diffusion facilitator family transporter [Haloferula luteola]